MNSLNTLRTFCRKNAPNLISSGFKNDVISVTSVVSSSYVPRKNSKRILKAKRVQPLPFKVAKSGQLHIYFHELSKDHGSVTKLKLLKRNIVVLNTADAVDNLFHRNKHTADGRLSPFFQHYVFQDKGFSFCDFTAVGEQQKQILKKFLHYQIEHSQFIITREVENVVKALLNANGDVNTDWFVRLFLSNVFCRSVSYLFDN